MDTERQIMRGTGQGLVEFLDSRGERGDINKGTARYFRISSGKVLAVESDDLASIDIRKVDVDDLLERFANLHRADYGASSLETYKSRFRRSVAMYIAFLDGNANWKTAGLTPAASKQRQNSARRANGRKASAGQQQATSETGPDATHPTPEDRTSVASASGGRLMTYDVPLRPDLIVTVTLPLDLTTEDAERFASFIKVLAFSSSRPGSESSTTQGRE